MSYPRSSDLDRDVQHLNETFWLIKVKNVKICSLIKWQPEASAYSADNWNFMQIFQI